MKHVDDELKAMRRERKFLIVIQLAIVLITLLCTIIHVYVSFYKHESNNNQVQNYNDKCSDSVKPTISSFI